MNEPDKSKLKGESVKAVMFGFCESLSINVDLRVHSDFSNQPLMNGS